MSLYYTFPTFVQCTNPGKVRDDISRRYAVRLFSRGILTCFKEISARQCLRNFKHLFFWEFLSALKRECSYTAQPNPTFADDE